MAYYPTNYRYDKENRVKVMVNFNRKTEPELVERITREENKSGYIKQLIREDIEREKEENK